MRFMRATWVLLIMAAATTAGCVDNMGELKEALGVRAPPPPLPMYDPPQARAVANATSVMAGVPVLFNGEQSRDPQGLPLTFRWQFSDAERSDGAVVTRAFATPGEWRVTLNVTNGAGLSDEVSLLVQVAPANTPPVPVLLVQDAQGRPLKVAEMGQAVRFSAAQSHDADGHALTYAWDFGEGATSLDATPRHTFKAPGLYDVKLRVTDERGATSVASRLVAVNAAFQFDGAFEASGSASRAHAFPVAEGASQVVVRLTFATDLGSNDLVIVLKDAKGTEVARSPAGVPPGERQSQTRELVVHGEALRAFEPGEWHVEVVKERGVQPTYSVVIEETF